MVHFVKGQPRFVDEAGQVFADIAEVPGFVSDTGDFFLALRIAQNKTVFVGVGV